MLLKLTLQVTGRADITVDGGITSTKGYADAFKLTCKKSGQITKNAVQWGKDTQVALVPFAAIGGAFGSAGYFVYGSVADAIRKGKDVQIMPNEILNVVLLEPIDVPVI